MIFMINKTCCVEVMNVITFRYHTGTRNLYSVCIFFNIYLWIRVGLTLFILCLSIFMMYVICRYKPNMLNPMFSPVQVQTKEKRSLPLPQGKIKTVGQRYNPKCLSQSVIKSCGGHFESEVPKRPCIFLWRIMRYVHIPCLNEIGSVL